MDERSSCIGASNWHGLACDGGPLRGRTDLHGIAWEHTAPRLDARLFFGERIFRDREVVSGRRAGRRERRRRRQTGHFEDLALVERLALEERRGELLERPAVLA